jgi:hypothetical protein
MGPPPPPPAQNQFLVVVPNPSLHSSSSGPGSLNETAQVEPLDYEEYVAQQQRLIRGQPKSSDSLLVDFPPDDIEVNVVPRKIRTLGHVLPEDPMYVDLVDVISNEFFLTGTLIFAESNWMPQYKIVSKPTPPIGLSSGDATIIIVLPLGPLRTLKSASKNRYHTKSLKLTTLLTHHRTLTT